jgi:hypothetical protein
MDNEQIENLMFGITCVVTIVCLIMIIVTL